MINLQNHYNKLIDQFPTGITPRQFALQLNGVNVNKVNNTLSLLGWFSKQGDVRGKYLTQGEASPESSERTQKKDVLTRDGVIAFYNLYLDRQLPMKSDWDGHMAHSLFTNESGR